MKALCIFVNKKIMRERIIKFLESENLSSSRFADDIGIQRSTVSHVLSGRNNPSFDFIQKILSKYKYLNAEWLIMGTGNMLKSVKQGNLFDNNTKESVISDLNTNNTEKMTSSSVKLKLDERSLSNNKDESTDKLIEKTINANIEKIITIYTDKTFDIYFPAK